jgi:chromosome segregation ATPase
MPRYPEIDDDMVVDDDMTVEELRELLQKREADLQAIQSALTNKEADNRVLAGIVQDLRAKVSALEKNVQHQGDVEILEYSVQKAIETIMKLKKRIAELESQQTSQQRRQLTTAEVEDLKGKFDKLMGDLVADEIDDKEFMRIYRRDFLAGRD